MVGNGSGSTIVSASSAYSRYSMAADVIQKYSSGGVSPQQRLSSYSLHSIVGKRDIRKKKLYLKACESHKLEIFKFWWFSVAFGGFQVEVCPVKKGSTFENLKFFKKKFLGSRRSVFFV